eukprot:gnl/TRDRNA2_/TRDRNA2_177069_c0_seq2.p2 gnl/TRDRNA2_/TRDRNA2_177069_c0~~gnl/TRDRNA2_/TRDRNA2_177069_c0_seq2.p2  ORF type:complete len:125 (-),score=23.72 gnl/TRDRNA2_/TRDRNA2_177069_c0_seq2:46-420(-)
MSSCVTSSILLAIFCAVAQGMLCSNHDKETCPERNDGGCKCVWQEGKELTECVKGDECDGGMMGVTSISEPEPEPAPEPEPTPAPAPETPAPTPETAETNGVATSQAFGWSSLPLSLIVAFLLQ